MPRNKLKGSDMKTVSHSKIQRKLQKEERSPMLTEWQNLYCENGYITKSNLHVQCNPHQNSNGIHHRY
jgi:hypothetical protein